MKTRAATLPLGIDLGRRRVRVALSAAGAAPKLLAVAAYEHDGDPAGALLAALNELQTPERRCVLALAPPEALLCATDFPAMSPWERVCAARFEAARFIDYPIADASVSLVRTSAQARWAIGVVRRSALAAALGAAKAAQLRPVAIDDMAFALQRAHPAAGGAIDVGADATRLTLFGAPVPYVVRLPIGGARMTDAIAQSLGIDAEAAEERKRSIGFGGAGEAPRDALMALLNEAFADARAPVTPARATSSSAGTAAASPDSRARSSARPGTPCTRPCCRRSVPIRCRPTCCAQPLRIGPSPTA